MEALIVSRGLDTNGQNARYVKAAKKHGNDPSVIRVMAIGKSDPAAVVTRFRLAAEKHGGLHIREAHRATAYMEFPTDIVWGRKNDAEVRALAEAADVVHLNNSDMAYRQFRLRKPALLHHHGTLFRSNPERLLAVAKRHRMVQATSTIDLLRFAPKELHWLPSAYDIDEMAAYGKAGAREPDGRVLIVHCPTNRAFKHTDLLVNAVAELQRDGLPVDLELVEGRPWADSLAAKARADIVFDQLLWGYGCNGIEAWAMGKPVIAGGDEWTLTEMMRQWDGLPFYEATAETLKGVISNMVLDADLRAEYAAAGHAHVRKYHDEKPALERLAYLYAEAIRRYSSHSRIAGKGPAVTFRQKGKAKVYVDDAPIVFQDGQLTTDDPYVIERLRTLALRPARFGIEEVA